jgi:E3 ubiquitin-protein ligase UBR1
MRAQQLHYREYNTRENTFDQDVYLLQLAFAAVDPSDVLLTMLDRFGLVPWLCAPRTVDFSVESVYDEAQAFAMTEEFLYLLIVLLSEPADVAGWSVSRSIRREIVHALCLGQCAYSDLLKRVSERLVEEADFDRILSEVATFRRPGGTNDQGIYILKDEYFDEVDPYYYRYSRNQREEADKVLKARLRRQTGDPSPVVVPRPLEIATGPSVSLSDVYPTEALVHILLYSISWACSPMNTGGNPFEAVIDFALHIAMRGLVEKPGPFGALLVHSTFEGSTFAQLLCQLEHDERLKATKTKTRWCLDTLTNLFPDVMSTIRIKPAAPLSKPSGSTDDSKKKAAAKARQAAIMKQFANAQKDFLASNVDFDDEDEVELDGEIKGTLGSCIVCQEELNAAEPFGSLALVQSSRLVRLEVSEERLLREVVDTPMDLDTDLSHLRPFGIASAANETPSASDTSSESSAEQSVMATAYPRRARSGLHASACGHMMHVRCHETYVKSIEHRHLNQVTRNHPENIDRHEFICPLCKSLGNVLVPVAETDRNGKSKAEGDAIDPRTLEDWAADVADASAARLSRKADGRLRAWKIDEAIPSIPGHYPDVTVDERTMMGNFMRVLWPLTRETYQDMHARYLNDELISYTVASIEIAHRGSGQPGIDLVQSLPPATLRLLRGLLHTSRKLALNGTPGGLTAAKLCVASAIVSRDNVETTQTPFLLRDPLAVLCDAAAVAPEEYRQFVAFTFYAHLMRVFVALPSLLAPVNVTHLTRSRVSLDLEGTGELIELAQLTRSAWGEAQPNKLEPWSVVAGKLGDLALGKLLYSYSLPFLRRATILAAAAGVPLAPAPTEHYTSELYRLLEGLCIPQPRDVLRPWTGTGSADVQVLHSLMESWHYRAAKFCALRPTGDLSSRLATQTEHPAIYELVGLPKRLDKLIGETLDRKCRRCQQSPSEPAICLLCGELVCFQSYCCMDQEEEEALYGESNMHMWSYVPLSVVARNRGLITYRFDIRYPGAVVRLGRSS